MRPVICQSGKKRNDHSGLGFLLCNQRPVQSPQIYGIQRHRNCPNCMARLISWSLRLMASHVQFTEALRVHVSESLTRLYRRRKNYG